MAFDLATAQPIAENTALQPTEAQNTGFDLSTAKPIINDNESHIVNDLAKMFPDTMRGLNKAAGTFWKAPALAGSILPRLFDHAFGTDLTTKYFDYTVAPLDAAISRSEIRPDAGIIGKVSHTIGNMAGQVAEMYLSAPAKATGSVMAANEMWPAIAEMIRHGTGAAAAPALASAIDVGQKVYDHTNDGMAAFNAAKASYLSTTANIILPLNIGGSMATRVGTSFASGIAMGELSREYMNSNMPVDMRSQYSFEDMLLNGVFAAGIGVIGPRGNPGMAKTKDITNAAIAIGEGKDTEALTGKLSTIMEKTGIEPGKVAADAMADPTIKNDLLFQNRRSTETERRTRYESMSPDERLQELIAHDRRHYTSALTGIPNKAALDVAQELPVKVFADIDGLKTLNDTLGHDAGDAAIKAMAKQIENVTQEVYHISGDEFKAQFHTEADANKVMNIARDRFMEEGFYYTDKNGNQVHKKGVGFSYGTGKDFKSAEANQYTDKADRKARGLRFDRVDAATTGGKADTGNAGNDIGAAAKLPGGIPDATGAARPETIKQIDTPEFKSWFGDSKVVDAEGNPLVMYHGSMTAGLTEITPGRDEPGAWFTRSIEYANSYAKSQDGEIYKVYLNSKNPLTVTFDYRNNKLKPFANGEALDFDNNIDIVKYAQKKGFDSVHFPDGNFSEESEAWVVFSSSQIKSATDNSGLFDPKNPDITDNRRVDYAARKEFDKAQAKPAEAVDPLIRESIDTGIPRAYIPAARERMIENVLFGTDRELNVNQVIENQSLGQITSEKAPNHINYKYVDSPEDVKAIHARISQVFEKQIAELRGKESWDATQAKAMDIIKNSGLKAGGGDFENLAGKAMAWEAMAQKAAFDVAEAARNVRAKAAEATPEDDRALVVAIESLAFLQAIDQGNGAEIARALNARKAAKQMSDIAKNTQSLFAQYGHDPQELARMIGEIGTKEGMAKFAAEASKATTWEKLVEGWKAGILSGPVTHVANLMGNGTFATMRLPIDTVAAAIGKLRGAPVEERISIHEPLARITGMIEGAKDGAKIAAAMIANEDALQEQGKSESFRHAIDGEKGQIIRLPFRALGAEDALFKTINERSEAYSLATRQAIIEGIDIRTREFKERVVDIMQNPPTEMQQAIDTAGKRYTFNMDLGPKGQAVQKLVKEFHLEFMVPFIRTPGNIAKELIRLTPFAPAVKEWRTALASGGIEADRAMAEVLVGSAIMSTVFAFALDGHISGAGDPDPAKRRAQLAAGWQPYSIKIGDTWYNYQRLQPIGTLMGMASDIAEVWEHMNDSESDRVPKMLSVAFANAITSQTFLQGITNVMNAMSDPSRFGPRLIQSFAGSTVPNIVAQPTAMLDPFTREVDSVRQAVEARIPGLRGDLLPKLDMFGEPIQSKERLGIVSPVTETTISTDKVRTEAARLGVASALAPKKIELSAMGQKDIGKVELTQQQQHDFTILSGQMAHEILVPIVNQPAWDNMPDMVKKQVYEKVFHKAQEVATVQAIPPEQRATEMQRIADEIMKRIEK